MAMILRLAFCHQIITLVGFLDGGPSHYRHRITRAPLESNGIRSKTLLSNEVRRSRL